MLKYRYSFLCYMRLYFSQEVLPVKLCYMLLYFSYSTIAMRSDRVIADTTIRSPFYYYHPLVVTTNLLLRARVVTTNLLLRLS